MMRILGRIGSWVAPVASAGLLALSCGSSEDDSSGGKSSGGEGGSAGFTPTPGCTTQPDCDACTDCLSGCICLTGDEATCQSACSMGQGGSGAGGQGGTGNTGNVGGGGTGNVGGGGMGGSGGSPPGTVFDCFQDIYGGMAFVSPNYDQFSPKVGSHCFGTNHQDIQNIQRVVFLGDSITFGAISIPGLTTAPDKVYRALLGGMLGAKFPGVQIDNCSENGARTDDFLMGGNQINSCFPTGGDDRNTLVIITMGGNDLRPIAEQKLDVTAAQPAIDKMVGEMNDAVQWLKDPMRFPNGSSVVFANVYEYTDTSADLGSCPGANLIGLTGEYLSAPAIVTQLHEKYMKIAVDHQADMIFMAEDFCGHGFRRDDPNLQCFRGPGTEIWFDLSCIHPNDPGHQHIADMFMATVNE